MLVPVKVITLAMSIAAAPLLHALTYRVVSRESTGAGAAATGTLSARRIDVDARVAPDTQLIRRDITIPSSGTLPVGEGTWELRVASDRGWAAPVYVDATSGREALIEVIPSARLQARVGKPGAAGLPPEVRVLLTAQEVQRGGERQQADVLCPLADRQILCTLPAGSWDVRIIATGFIPQFRWNVRLPADVVTEIEPVALVTGAAVIGTVERVGRGVLPADSLVRLVPSSVAGPASARLGLQTKPNAKGFFEFSAIAPGEYFITASSNPPIAHT